MRFIYLSIMLVAFALLGCKNKKSTKTDDNTNDRYLSVNSTLNTDKTSTLTIILQSYLDLKNAYTESDEPKVNDASKYLALACKTLQDQISSDTINAMTPSPQLDTIIQYCEQTLSIKDKSVELKRVPLKTISNALYQLLKEYKLKGVKIYQQYCPLVFNENGAYWLSSEKEIQNPYLGKKMLECGEVVDIIE